MGRRDDGDDELERGFRAVYELVRGSRLVEAELSASVKALVDTLVASGTLKPEAFERRRQKERDAAIKRQVERPAARLGDDVDKYRLGVLPEIDCASLLPICKARCCTLDVYLSPQDLDERVLRWEYGRPYRMRKTEDGYCSYCDPATRACTAYGHRPAVCRSYDCRNDKRIWKDFERRIPRA